MWYVEDISKWYRIDPDDPAEIDAENGIPRFT
jgi:hypothetical protein